MRRTKSVVIAGLGGQGVLTAAEILAQAAFLAGCDVKKSEVHGMAQRGGLVISDVRFGVVVYSPMTSLLDADCVILLDSTQLAAVSDRLRGDGVLITPGHAELRHLPAGRHSNLAMLGIASRGLGIATSHFECAIAATLKSDLRESSVDLFRQFADATCGVPRDAATLPTPRRFLDGTSDVRITTE